MSCSNVKHLPKGEKLYTGARVHVQFEDSIAHIKKSKELETELSSLIRPKPNTRLFGVARVKLWFYEHAGTPKKKGLRYLVKNRLGEPPVLLSKVSPSLNIEILKNHLENQGYFTPEVFSTIHNVGKYKTKIDYYVRPGRPYTIRKVIFPKKDSSINGLIAATAEDSYISPGDEYNLDTLKSERERINAALKEQGLYYFSADDIIFKADTTAGDHQVDIYVLLKRRTPLKAQKIYKLNNIYVFADHSLFADSVRRKPDTLMVQGYYYITSHQIYRPEIIVSSVFLQKGALYNYDDYYVTLNRLMRLGIYKFVNIRFEEDSLNKGNKLNVFIYLTPLPRKSLRTELKIVSKSDNFAGPLLNLSFKNRNVFKGAEILTLNASGSIETIINGQGKGLTSSTIGSDANLSIPRFIVPFVKINPPTRFVPLTEFKLGYQKLSEIKYYNLNTFSFSAGYHWNESEYKEHIFNPVVINFLKLGNTSTVFDSILDRNISLKRSFATQFVIGSYYSFVYNSQVTQGHINDFYFKGTADVSGNLLGVVQSVFKNYHETPDHPYNIFREPYSQYVLGTADFRHYLNFSKGHQLVSRIFAGAGLPYGNSATLPYIKEFFAGGNNSIRAFPSRYLGPGSYHLPKDQQASVFVDQVGDIKLEGNIEYRFPIAGVLKGALFTDAGNIWLLHEDTARPGGEFYLHSFYKQIAVGSGFGLRIDASYFVLRFDIAFPLRKPYPTDGHYWVLNSIKPLDGSWRNNNLILNIGIGYPF